MLAYSPIDYPDLTTSFGARRYAFREAAGPYGRSGAGWTTHRVVLTGKWIVRLPYETSIKLYQGPVPKAHHTLHAYRRR